MGGLDDSGDVLHFEGQRTRGFGIDHTGVGLDEQAYLAADARIVKGSLHAEAAQDGIAEHALGAVHGIGHEHMVASTDKAEDGLHAGGKAGARDHRARALFELIHRIAEGKCVFRAKGAVADVFEHIVAALVGFVLLQRGGNDGRSAVYGHVHRGAHTHGGAARMGKNGIFLHGLNLSWKPWGA